MKKLYALAFVALIAFDTKAQLFVDTSYTAQQMVSDFFGTSGCVSVSNITYTGPNASLGFFDAANTNIGLNAGMLITSGTVHNAATPNLSSSTSGVNGLNGAPFLDALVPGYFTYDASIVEFDIVPSNDTMCFEYVFGSEEFNEFVGSSFNDVFGFFISGPGFGVDSNIALIPGTQTVVAVNNVNCIDNSTYYVCNDPWNATTGCLSCPTISDSTMVEYDGFTTPLCAKLVVTPGATYHVKMAVADAGDQILDSGVFLSIESLCGGATLACVADFLPGFGADPNEISFDNESVYGSSWTWDFGDGYTSTEKNPTHEYSTDGTYNVMLVTCNFSGCDTTYQSITVGTTGINTPALSDVIVFPNPATNSLSIKSISGNAGSVSIFDAAGRLMLQTEMNGDALVDISSLTNGVYTVELLSHHGVHRTRFYKH